MFNDKIVDSASDYRPMPALDRYEQDVLDDEQYSDISQGDRRAAEQVMRRRDQEEGARRGDVDLLYGQLQLSCQLKLFCIIDFRYPSNQLKLYSKGLVRYCLSKGIKNPLFCLFYFLLFHSRTTKTMLLLAH